jgi:uncharacterized protein (DUF1800 family)
MGSIEGQTLGRARARQLLRRSGFGALPADVATYQNLGAGAAVDRLLAFKPSGFKPNGSGNFFTAQRRQHDNWVKSLLKLQAPEALREKLVLFWHDHFATGISKVADPKLMGVQNQTIRKNCAGDMRVLVKAMNVDPAMIEWLDTVRNFKEIPNENYARELMELFTLGVFDLSLSDPPVPNYAQADIVQIARAFTGHSYNGRSRKHEFHHDDHDVSADFPERGPKVIFQTSGGFGGGGRNYLEYPVALNDADPGQAAREIDNVIDVLFAHRDSQGQNTIARRTAKRLLEYFAHGGFASPTPELMDVVDAVVDRSGFASTFRIRDLVREVLLDEEVYASAEGDLGKKSVKWPIDYYVGTLRLLGVKVKGGDAFVPGQLGGGTYDRLAEMGQTVLDPPSVFGWDWETSWISSQTLLARYSFATDVITARGSGGMVAKKLFNLSLQDPGAIVDAVTDLLGVKDDLTPGERGTLVAYMGPGPIDLNDYDTRNRKLHGLIGLVLESPAYQVH